MKKPMQLPLKARIVESWMFRMEVIVQIDKEMRMNTIYCQTKLVWDASILHNAKNRLLNQTHNYTPMLKYYGRAVYKWTK